MILHVLLFSLWVHAAPVVVIDPGHGGSQWGAKSPAGKLEKNLTLQIGLKLKAVLIKDGCVVRMTRDKDEVVHLSDRVIWANQQHPDVFVSVHLNSMPTRKQRLLIDGIETYFLATHSSTEQAKRVAAAENADVDIEKKKKQGPLDLIIADLQRSDAHVNSSRLAYSIHEQLVKATGAVDRGVQQAPFFVLMGLEAPAVLVETGFISHPEEGANLADSEYQEKVADAIAKGIRKFLEATKTAEKPEQK